jgi:predicted O-linked N-acetylglucosamine transferase (SPINDLY family)
MISLDPQAFQDELDKAFRAFAAGEAEEAVDRAEAARRLNPGAPEPLFVLGLAAFTLNDIGAAIRFMDEAHRLDPDGREIAEVLGALHGRAGNLSESLYYTKLAVALDDNPRFAGLLPESLLDFVANVGQARQSAYLVDAGIEFFLRRFDKAADFCRRELELRPGGAEAHQLMGRALFELGRYEEAVHALETAARFSPRDALGFVYLAEGLRKQGRLDVALDCCREAVRLDPASPRTRSELLSTLAYMPFEEWRTYPNEAKAAIAAIAPGPRPASPAPAIDAKTVSANRRDKIRVGYLINETAMLRDIGFLETVLAHQNHSRFYSYVYQQYSRPLGDTARLQNEADDWRPVYNIDDETFAHIVVNDALDVLVDLCGAAAGRPALLARRPAPVQISWLGFPQGSLPETVDWLLSDASWAEFDKRDAGGAPLLWLDDWAFAYMGASVAIEAEDEQPLPAQASQSITFGGVCDLARVAGSVPLWAQALRATPGSRLLLGRAPLPDEDTRRRIRDMFAPHDVADRIVFHETAESRPAAAFYSAIDIMLDTLPVNNAVESCEALWRGVPVISCRGDRRAGVLGATILTAAGRPEWIAKSAGEFADIARALSADLDKLAALRKSLPGEFRKSRMCDAKRFALAFETLLSDLSEKSRAKAGAGAAG